MAELDKHLESKHYNNGYSKADEKVIKSIFLPQINTALTNAKIVHQERINIVDPNSQPQLKNLS